MAEAEHSKRFSSRSPSIPAEIASTPRSNPNLLMSHVPQSVDLTVATLTFTISSASASVISSTPSSSLTLRLSYIEEIHYVNPEPEFGPQATATEYPKVPLAALLGPGPF